MPVQDSALTDLASVATTGRVAFDPSSCRTCRVCEIACSVAHEGIASPSLSRINITFDEFAIESPIHGVICYQCVDAPCIEACPVDALSRDASTGAVRVDESLCIGCMRCRKACPWDVPKRHPDKRLMLKCDLCSDRPAGPACLELCPLEGKALRLVDPTMEKSP